LHHVPPAKPPATSAEDLNSYELAILDAELRRLTEAAAPALSSLKGVGPDVAGALLVAAGDSPERLRSEASFASLCGAAPIPASSGKTTRHRLNRGGDRIANNALWRIVMVRLASDKPTQNYMVHRTQEGRSKREIIRCLKRYVAREVYRALLTPGNPCGGRLMAARYASAAIAPAGPRTLPSVILLECLTNHRSI